MSGKVIFVLTVLIASLLAPGSLSAQGRDERSMQRYPGGEYGMSIGGGYAMAPDGELIEPSEYRDPYIDTEYGPLTRKGFLLFPGYEVGGSAAPRPVKEEKAKIEDFIFHEATTSAEETTTTMQSDLWGVYSPGDESE